MQLDAEKSDNRLRRLRNSAGAEAANGCGRTCRDARQLRSLAMLMFVLVLFVGCRRNLAPPMPVVFQQPPNLNELLATVNSHTDRILDLQTDAGRLSADGYPGSARANLRMLRPKHLRLQASFLSNSLLDMGSNDDLFWFWSPQQPVLYARHAQFASSRAGQVLPVDPTWLVDAMGLIHFDQRQGHRGPFQRTDGMIEVHTPMPSATGQRIRVTAIHPQYGYVTEVQMRDANGRLLALAQASDHRYDETHQVTLPHRLYLELVESPLPMRSFTFETESYAINQLQTAAANPGLWTMPPGPSQDLAATASATATSAAPPTAHPARMGVAPRVGATPRTATAPYRPEFRGYRRE